MATDQAPPDDLDPGHIMTEEQWAAVEETRRRLLAEGDVTDEG